MDKAGGFLYRIHVDGSLMAGLMVTCLLGLVVLYSASDQSGEVVVRQAIRMTAGFCTMLVIAQVSPQQLARFVPMIYVVGLFLLVMVLVFGTGRGAQRWLDLGLFRFQPSELMKLAVPLTVATILSRKSLPPSLPVIIIAIFLVVIPSVLIFRQPDLGTAILVASSGLFVLFFAGTSWKLIGGSTVLAFVTAPVVWLALRDYQRGRILTLFNPERDPLGAGYHIIQSRIAVGSGGIEGKGWLNGTQSHLEFLPERATDFIFAVYCEEFGFIGVVILLLAYTLLITRGIKISIEAQDTFGRLVGASLTLTFFLYVFVNMGMVIGQLPVVGVPLPLVSYGGTSLVTILTAFGVLMSIQTHRRLNAET